jgi:hypothetical protein
MTSWLMDEIRERVHRIVRFRLFLLALMQSFLVSVEDLRAVLLSIVSASASCIHACNEGQRIHQATSFFVFIFLLLYGRKKASGTNMLIGREETGTWAGSLNPKLR